MSDYTQIVDYSAKDALATGDPAKKILGSEIDAEFSAISTAVASKANSAAPALTGAGTLDGRPITSFPSGTAMLFAQTAAPTGWTKSTTHNNKALRVVSGTAGSGGATAFTTVFGAGKTTGSHTLTTAEIPAHSHGVTDPGHVHGVKTFLETGGTVSGQANSATGTDVFNTNSATTGITIQNTGGGGGHSHTLSLDLQYVDVIIATKD